LNRFDFFHKQNLFNNEKKNEKIKDFNNYIEENKIFMIKHTNHFKICRKIEEMRKEVRNIEDKLTNNYNLIQMLKKIITQKKQNIQFCTSFLNMCRESYKDKKNNMEIDK